MTDFFSSADFLVLLAVDVALVAALVLIDAWRDRRRAARKEAARRALRLTLFKAIYDNPRRPNDVYSWLKRS